MLHIFFAGAPKPGSVPVVLVFLSIDNMKTGIYQSGPDYPDHTCYALSFLAAAINPSPIYNAMNSVNYISGCP